MTLVGERTVTVDCDVIQADGGTRTAAITGGWVAMALAFHNLLDAGMISRMPVTDYIAAISVGIVNGVALLDLCYEEDSRADVDMNVVMNRRGEYVELQASAERNTFSAAQLHRQLELANAGISSLIEGQRKLVHIPRNA